MTDSSPAMLMSSIKSLPLIGRGKVRDMYKIDDEHMLIITTDRLSAFDVVLPDPIPAKGQVLVGMSNFWFKKLQTIIPNHLTEIDPVDVVAVSERSQVRGRSVVVKKLKPLPIEAVVRAYLIGSGWEEYISTGKVSGIELPPHLELASKLPQALFTPTTKAPQGEHDKSITFSEMTTLIDANLATSVKDTALRLYNTAAEFAKQQGILIADTKFEFGLDNKNQLVLIDEVLTADSTRYWPADQYKVGISPPSFDKQYVRDYLHTLTWNKQAPGPLLPKDVISKTSEKYMEIYKRLTGIELTLLM